MATEKRKKKKGNNYLLYTAVALIVVAFAVGGAIIYNVVHINDTDESSAAEESSQPSAADESSESVIAESSTPDESSEVPEESSEPPKKSWAEMNTAERIADYEERVGVKYAIDMTDYEAYVCPDDEAKYVFLVDPVHTLGSDYVPEDLIKCTHIREGRPDSYNKIVRTVDIALDAFLKEAAYYGFDDITVTNAYRSYRTQDWLFNYYVDQEWNSGKFKTKEEAIAEVLTYSTRPGTSEHQSGLCCDMHNVDISTPRKFNGTPAATWMEENAYRFGFILRYPDGKQDITGIIYESWHFRYVGRTAATEIHDLGVTLDEYLADERA